MARSNQFNSQDDDIDAPQQADVDQFGNEFIKCPKCLAKIYDDVDWCHKCGHALGAEEEHKVKPWILITGMVLLATTLLWLIF